MLLISRYGLEVKPFHQYREVISWEQCTLRGWMNGEFLTDAFDEREQGAFNSQGGKNTKDKLFLLSYAEANKYFGTEKKRLCEPTPYVFAKNVSGGSSCDWWLRSPGPEKNDYTGTSKYSQSAEAVVFEGKVFNNYVDTEDNAVRPALWLNLDSEFF